jgi:hypothetical protein
MGYDLHSGLRHYTADPAVRPTRSLPDADGPALARPATDVRPGDRAGCPRGADRRRGRPGASERASHG